MRGRSTKKEITGSWLRNQEQIQRASSCGTSSSSGEEGGTFSSDLEAAEYYKCKGNTAFAEKSYAAAIEAYAHSLQLKPDAAVVHANKAAAHIKLKQYEVAVTDCTEAIELNPRHMKAWKRRAEANYCLGNFAAVVPDAAKALELDPSQNDLVRLKSKALKRLEEQQHSASSSVEPEALPAMSPGKDRRLKGKEGGAGTLGSDQLSAAEGGQQEGPTAQQAAEQEMSWGIAIPVARSVEGVVHAAAPAGFKAQHAQRGPGSTKPGQTAPGPSHSNSKATAAGAEMVESSNGIPVQRLGTQKARGALLPPEADSLSAESTRSKLKQHSGQQELRVECAPAPVASSQEAVSCGEACKAGAMTAVSEDEALEMVVLDPCLQALALVKSAESLTQEQDLQAKVELYSKALELMPAETDFYLGRAAASLAAGHNHQAFKDCTIALRLMEEDSEVPRRHHFPALQYRSAARAAEGDLRGADADLARAISCAPTKAEEAEAKEERSRLVQELVKRERMKRMARETRPTVTYKQNTFSIQDITEEPSEDTKAAAVVQRWEEAANTRAVQARQQHQKLQQQHRLAVSRVEAENAARQERNAVRRERRRARAARRGAPATRAGKGRKRVAVVVEDDSSTSSSGEAETPQRGTATANDRTKDSPRVQLPKRRPPAAVPGAASEPVAPAVHATPGSAEVARSKENGASVAGAPARKGGSEGGGGGGGVNAMPVPPPQFAGSQRIPVVVVEDEEGDSSEMNRPPPAQSTSTSTDHQANSHSAQQTSSSVAAVSAAAVTWGPGSGTAYQQGRPVDGVEAGQKLAELLSDGGSNGTVQGHEKLLAEQAAAPSTVTPQQAQQQQQPNLAESSVGSRRENPEGQSPLPAVPAEQLEYIKMLGDRYQKAGQYSQAEEQYSEFLQYDPADVRVWSNRAQNHILMGRFSEALGDCQAGLAVQQPSKEVPPHKLLARQAVAQQRLGRFSDAVSSLEAAIDAAPSPAHRKPLSRKLLQLIKEMEAAGCTPQPSGGILPPPPRQQQQAQHAQQVHSAAESQQSADTFLPTPHPQPTPVRTAEDSCTASSTHNTAPPHAGAGAAPATNTGAGSDVGASHGGDAGAATGPSVDAAPLDGARTGADGGGGAGEGGRGVAGHSAAKGPTSLQGEVAPDRLQRSEEARALGNARFKEDNWLGAVIAYVDAVHHNPGCEKTHANLAAALLKLGEWKRAKDHCDAALRLAPQYSKAYLRRAVALKAMGELAEAYRDLTVANKLEPGDPLVLQELRSVSQAAAMGDPPGRPMEPSPDHQPPPLPLLLRWVSSRAPPHQASSPPSPSSLPHDEPPLPPHRLLLKRPTVNRPPVEPTQEPPAAATAPAASAAGPAVAGKGPADKAVEGVQTGGGSAPGGSAPGVRKRRGVVIVEESDSEEEA